MSFSNTAEPVGLKKFVSEDELEEKRKKRQQEWEKVRQPEDPTECPEEVYDPRSLFEQLETQKQKKQDEYDEQFKMRNQVKGLGEDEAKFLDYVSNRQIQIDKQRQQEDATVIRELRDSSVAVTPVEAAKANKEEKKVLKPQVGASQGKSQMALLAGAIKRKSSDTQGGDGDKKRKLSDQETNSDSTETPETDDPAQNKSSKNSGKLSSVARVIGILPGLGEYTNDTSDSETSDSSDSEIECKTIQPTTGTHQLCKKHSMSHHVH